MLLPATRLVSWCSTREEEDKQANEEKPQFDLDNLEDLEM